MSPRIKVCGLTRVTDARLAARLGADYLGVVQHPASPRYLAPEQAAAITAAVDGPIPVGVFVDRAAEAVVADCAVAGFRVAQLHGDEPPEACAAVRAAGLGVVKAFRVRPGESAAALDARVAPYLGVVDAVLLDAYHPDAHGGTGRRFDWALARSLARRLPLFLAGGLGAANVAEATAAVAPFALDLSSSVEAAPGRKDARKLAALFDACHALSAPVA